MERTREHEIEALSNQFLERCLVDWICNKLHNDYGLDYLVEITENRKTTGNIFFIQVKGTDSLDKSGEFITFSISVRHLQYFLQIPDPVLFFRYYAQNDAMYWLNVQKFAREYLNSTNPRWETQTTVTLKIPLVNTVTDKNSLKEEIIKARMENARVFVDGLKWFEGNEKLLCDVGAIENALSKQEKEVNLKRLHAAMLNSKGNELGKAQELLLKVYIQKSESVEHLQTILALISGKNILEDGAQSEIGSLAREGKQLAKKLHEDIYSQIFAFYLNLIPYAQLRKEILPLMAFRINPVADLDYLVTLYRNVMESRLAKQAEGIFIIIRKILDELFSHQSYIEFFYLELTLFLVENSNVYVLLNAIKGKPEEKLIIENLKKQEPFFVKLVETLELTKNQDLILYGYCQLGARIELTNPEKAKSIYEKGLKYASEHEDRFNVNKFTELLQSLGREESGPSPEEMLNLPLAEIIQRIRDSWKSKPQDELIGMALRDLDPLIYLQQCTNLKISYSPSLLGQMLVLYSFGQKRISCVHTSTISEGFDLKSLYDHFFQAHCRQCSHREPRETGWCLTLRQLDQMGSSI